MFIVPAYKDNNQVSRGRGKGGLVTMWKKYLTKYVSRVQCNNFRLQATKFSFPNCPVLIINSYFPCDPRTDNFDDSEIVEILGDLQVVIRQAQCGEILLVGDLNCHFQRQTRFSNLVRDFLLQLGLIIVWENPDSHPEHQVNHVDYTHCSVVRGVASYSVIDHFVSSQGLYNAISEAGVIHSGENTSNHSAIFLKLKVGELDFSMEETSEQPRISWNKANIEAHNKYRTTLKTKLDGLVLPVCESCTNLKCKVHNESIEEYTMEVMEAIESAGKECLPSVGKMRGTSTGVVAGWSEHVKPFAQESKFWSSVWVSLGRPTYGEVFENMKLSKRQYKYAVRRLKRVNDRIKNERFVTCLLDGGSNIFTEIRRHRGTYCTLSSRIDDEVGQGNIAAKFASIYSELYNKVEIGPELERMKHSIEDKVTGSSAAQLDRVNEYAVNEALKVMKGNKRDGIFDIVSDCLINGPPELVSHLTRLIKLFISHGFVPHFILLCTLLPLVKDNLGNITASDNYRAIASGSLLLKLLDIVVLQLEGDKLGFDQLQFAYQAKASTTMCSWTVTAVIDHFNRSGSAVYGAAMDMSKAFDLVEWRELFRTLLDRRVEPIFLRLMLYIYMKQMCNVKWGDKYSDSFSVANGVRQGAVSSAILFAVYIDKLLDNLRRAGFGCHIHGVFLGALVFADDIMLLSATRSGLQTMIDICSEFADGLNLKFGTNADPVKSKTKCIVFSKNRKHPIDPLPLT